MRVINVPWLILVICLIIVVLLFTMNLHNSIMSELRQQKDQMASIDFSIKNLKMPIAAPHPQALPIIQTFSTFKQKALLLQDFKPDTFIQDNSDRDYKTKLQSLIDQQASADNAELVKIIRNYFIQQPSSEAYNLLNPERLEFSNGQTPFVDSRLNYMECGFYVECGALNGEKGSNSLFFERVRKWNGLLIEADPSNYAELKKKNRKAFSINACLSPRMTAAKLNFNKAFNMGRVIHNKEAERWMNQVGMKKDMVEIECFPLYSMMLALNRTTIDFFSLDVEGDELNVLKTIPYDKLDIKMMTVEYAHGGSEGHEIQRFLEEKGYEVMLKVAKDDWGVNDLIFRKKGLTH